VQQFAVNLYGIKRDVREIAQKLRRNQLAVVSCQLQRRYWQLATGNFLTPSLSQ
jgi:hypothetical protein